MLAPDKQERVFAMALAGASVRAIRASTGVAKNTVMRYRELALATGDVRCGCGGPLKHRGWCGYRVKRSAKRQDFLGRWSRHSVIEWVWRVLVRTTRNRFVDKKTLRACMKRLAYKHSSRPLLTISRLSRQTWFMPNILGAWNGQPIVSLAHLAELEAGDRDNWCRLIGPTCKICDAPCYCESKAVWQKTCGKEWCNRIYAFYYVEGRNRPPTVRGGKNNGLKFEFFLSDYIRRLAHEQITGSQHRRAA